MTRFKILTTLLLSLLVFTAFIGCGGGGGSSGAANPAANTSNDSKFDYRYEGLLLYAKNMPVSSYRLAPLGDAGFNALDDARKKIVADKLLSTFYFGMPRAEIERLIDSGTFISTIQTMTGEKKNDLQQVETRLNDNGRDDEEFRFSTWPEGTAEVSRILARFYVMEHLDKHYIDYWSAYVLSSTIMFSPAYELASSHTPNIDRVYGELVRNFRDETTAKYSTFMHMISDDNWR